MLIHKLVTLYRIKTLIFSLLISLVLTACVGDPMTPKSQDVAVAPFISVSPSATTTQTNIKREQLSAEIMRYADRYSGRMSLEADRIKSQATTADMRWFASGWNLMSQKTVLDISIGPNAVENLLDMLVFASLTRIEVESYWVPDYLGQELGAGLLQSSRILEEDIWGLSAQVLTPEQQQNLRIMIQEWQTDNPDLHFFWAVRFSGFSSQRAKDLERIEQTGGLLAEVQMTRETAAEIQAFSERLLHYLQRAPGITRLETEFAMREALRTPEINQLMDDAHILANSSARYAAIGEKLPADTNTIFNNLFEQLSHEREAALTQLHEKLSQERIAAIDYLAKRQLELMSQLLVSKELEKAVDHISDEGGEIANVTFIRGAILILLWVVAYVCGKLGYDYIKHRIAISRQS